VFRHIATSAVAAFAFNQLAYATCDFSATGRASAQAATDGVVLARAARGISDATLIGGNVSTLSASATLDAINQKKTFWDIDRNGQFDEYDAKIIARYLAGFRGDVLAADGVSPFARRGKLTDIDAFMQAGCPVGGVSSTGSTTTPLAYALQTGDASSVNIATMFAATSAQLARVSNQTAAQRQAIFSLASDGSATANTVTGIDWDPTHDSVTFGLSDWARTQPLFMGNWRYKGAIASTGEVLGVVGAHPRSAAKHAVFGGNPMGQRGNAAMDQLVQNTMLWLTGKTPQNALRVVTAHLPQRQYYQHEQQTRAWIAARWPSATINGVTPAQLTTNNTCDGEKLATCLADADLLVIGSEAGPTGDTLPATYTIDTILSAVDAAQSRGVPVLMLNHGRGDTSLSPRLFEYFGVQGKNNYWNEVGLNAMDPTTQNGASLITNLRDLISRLAENRFSTNFSGCKNDSTTGFVTKCDDDALLQSEFEDNIDALRLTIRGLDERGVAIFEQPGYLIEKHLVLLGDALRAAVRYYPNGVNGLDKLRERDQFFRAAFSDAVSLNTRRHALHAPDQGSFGAAIPANTIGIERDVSLRAFDDYRREYPTGLYAIPGRSVTITRTDNSGAQVSIVVNMLRDTTRIYDTNGYTRPKRLGSPRIVLAPGATTTITSPYGGPIYVFVEKNMTEPETNLRFSGAITHPILRNMRDAAQVAAFNAEVASTPTNWVVLASEYLTIHTTKAKFRQTLTAHGESIDLLADRIWKYMIKDTYELAGFNTEAGDLSLAPGVAQFCAANGWDCGGIQHRRGAMQHVISDQALCGSGCAGNPYDQNWALEPLGWGETHEIGHNLQRARTKIYDDRSGEVSNNIYPAHKIMAYNRAENPATPLTRDVGATQNVFNVLVASMQSGASATHVYDAVWSNAAYAANNSFRLAFYRQLVEYARHYNPAIFTDGWELYTLMHLQERNFSAASAQWNSASAALGFSTYATYPSSISANDFMLISASRIIGRDMRPIWTMYGITFSAEAAAQVASFNYAQADKLLFPMRIVNAHGNAQTNPAANAYRVGPPVLVQATAIHPAGY
jgi:immunomodulating metalloprotease